MPTETYTRMELRWLVEDAIREQEWLVAQLRPEKPEMECADWAAAASVLDSLRHLEEYLK